MVRSKQQPPGSHRLHSSTRPVNIHTQPGLILSILLLALATTFPLAVRENTRPAWTDYAYPAEPPGKKDRSVPHTRAGSRQDLPTAWWFCMYCSIAHL